MSDSPSPVAPNAAPMGIDVGLLFEWTTEPPEWLTRSIPLLRDKLRQAFPEFDWRFKTTILARPNHTPHEAARGRLAMELLEAGASYLEREHLDFALVVTPRTVFDDRNVAAAIVSSQLLGCGVISIAGDGVVPLPVRSSASYSDLKTGDVQNSTTSIADRLFQALARLNSQQVDARAATLAPHALLPDALMEEWRLALRAVADERLEESRTRRTGPGFYVASIVVNLREVLRSVYRTRPWLFPFRLSKVTAGAVSTALIVMLTAESWQLANAQAPSRGVAIAVGVILSTVVYLLRQQDLLASVHRFRLSERRVIAEVATVLAVALGMLSTFSMLFIGSIAIGLLLFPAHVVTDWATAGGAIAYVKMSLLTATISVTVGALGASLEAPSYLRFVISVDSVLSHPHK